MDKNADKPVVVTVYRQQHRDYPPWVAMVKQETPSKAYMRNFEGNTEGEARGRAEAWLKSKGTYILGSFGLTTIFGNLHGF